VNPPKKRSKENVALPKRWRWQHNALYYLVPPNQREVWDNKTWFRLGKTLAEAHRTFSKRIYKGAEVITIGDLLDRFEWEHLPTLAPATQKYYKFGLPMVRKVFATNPVAVDSVEPCHAYQMTDFLVRTESPKKAKQAVECLSSALTFAVRKGVIKRNTLIGQFKKPTTQGRTREVTDQELISFAMTLPRKWQLYLSLKLHTKGRRKGELLRVMRSDMTEEGIVFTNNKRDSDRFIVEWTSPLRKLVTEIIDIHPTRIGDCHLFFGKGFVPYIKEDGTTSGFDTMWQRYMRKAIKNETITERFTEHDLRAKAVEDETLDVASRLLRHTSTQVTAKHYRRKPEKL
jgi:hypothetical protein